MPGNIHAAKIIVLFAFMLLAQASPARCAEPFRISRVADDTGTIQYFPIVKEAYRRIGIEAVAVPLPAERALREADAGLTDGDTIRVAGIEAFFPNLMRVPEPVASVDVTVFTRGEAFPVNGWESLKPYSVCYMHGLKLHEIGTEGMRRVPAYGQQNAVQLLRDGLCDAAVLSPNAWMMVDRLNAGPMRELEPPVDTLPLYHYLHERHARLVPLLADALRKMKQDGTVDRMLKPYREALRQAKIRQSVP